MSVAPTAKLEHLGAAERERRRRIFPGRLMAGRRSLEPLMVVRIHPGELAVYRFAPRLTVRGSVGTFRGCSISAD